MGPSDLVDLSGKPTPDAETDTKDHGLRFTNEDWNGSIANSHAFTLRWNESITDDQGALRLFRILYPEDGVMSFEPVSNLTDSMDERSCVWTPNGLSNDNLYALWVTRGSGDGAHWSISPPWKPLVEKRGPSNQMHWRNSVGIPIIVVLGVYFVSLATCLLYRRRRKASKANKAAAAARETRRRDQKRSASSVLLPPPEVTHDGRHPSVSSIGTAQTLTEDEPYYVRKKDLEMGSGGSGSSGSSGSRSAGCRSCGSCGGGTSGRSGGGRGRGSSRSAAYVLRNHPQQPPPTNPGVAWNRVVWRRESSAEYPLPVPTPSMYGTPVAGDWDYRAPIGQAL